MRGIGDRTDIPNWPEWFTGPDSSTLLSELYNEADQNVGDFGEWSRLSSNPGGENTIIMFKSCFLPNSDLFGSPNGTHRLPHTMTGSIPSPTPRAVYNNLLSYFQEHQEKLFIVITAPPQLLNDYNSDYQTPQQRAANARAFNTWLVSDWLDDYPYSNVGVFDYFNVLTAEGNITLFCFCNRLAPFKQVLPPSIAANYNINMMAALKDSRVITLPPYHGSRHPARLGHPERHGHRKRRPTQYHGVGKRQAYVHTD